MAFQPSNFLLGLPGTAYGAIATVPTGAVITSDGGGPTADVSVSTGDTAVTTVTASGTGTEVFSISGGAEANMFTINSGSGALAFATASVVGEYEVIVKAINDWGSDTQTITVTVAYHADAVTFDGTQVLINNSLQTTDSPFLSFSCWVKNAVDTPRPLWTSDPLGNFATLATISLNGWTTTLCDAAVVNFFEFENNTTVGNEWYHIMGSVDTNHAIGAKIAKLYVDGVDVTSITSDTTDAFSIALDNLPFYFGADDAGAKVAADFADFWFAFGQSLLVAGDIPEATRLKFRSAGGKPVDLGADGSTPTGTAPTIFFSGDATAFATNRGTGDAFALTGSLANASTSPSD